MPATKPDTLPVPSLATHESLPISFSPAHTKDFEGTEIRASSVKEKREEPAVPASRQAMGVIDTRGMAPNDV